MKTKLLRKLRKRFYWDYRVRGRLRDSVILDKKSLEEKTIFNPDNSVSAILGLMLIVMDKFKLYSAHQKKKEQRRIIKKYKTIL